MDRLDGLLGVTPLVVGDLILVEVVQGFRHERDVATARRLFHAMALLPMLGVHNPWKTPENDRKLRSKGITVRKTIDGIMAMACMETQLPLLFSDCDFLPYVRYLGLEAA